MDAVWSHLPKHLGLMTICWSYSLLDNNVFVARLCSCRTQNELMRFAFGLIRLAVATESSFGSTRLHFGSCLNSVCYAFDCNITVTLRNSSDYVAVACRLLLPLYTSSFRSFVVCGVCGVWTLPADFSGRRRLLSILHCALSVYRNPRRRHFVRHQMRFCRISTAQ